MGRAIAMAFFFLAFVVFAFIKMAGRGVKAAYKAVFDPNSTDENVKRLMAQIYAIVNDKVAREYRPEPGCLENIIVEVAPTVKMLCESNGFTLTPQEGLAVILTAIQYGHPNIQLDNMWAEARNA